MSQFEKSDQIVQSMQFSESDQQELLQKLWVLLKWQAGKYNGIDSTSLPIVKAQELLASLVYTLSVAASEDGISTEDLLQKDFHTVIKRGQDILDQKRKSVKILWDEMCLLAPGIQNFYYTDTIKNIGSFFEHYEIYYAAHEIPCSIDYPLITPVSDEVKGISYIEEYLKRIKIENQFVKSFDDHIVIRLFESYSRSYKEDYFNMCELVFTNAIGCKLLGLQIFSLDISQSDQNELVYLFDEKTKEECNVLVDNAVKFVCQDVGIEDKQIANYFKPLTKGLSVRINSAIKCRNLTHIFISLLPEEIVPSDF